MVTTRLSLFDDQKAGITPENIDPRAFLGIAQAWFELLDKVAAVRHLDPLEFRGIKIVRGSIHAVSATPAHREDDVLEATGGGRAMLDPTVPVPPACRTPVLNLQRNARRLPEGCGARFEVGQRVISLPLRVDSQVRAPEFHDHTEVRCRIVRCGIQPPSVRVVLDEPDEPSLTLKATKAMAVRLGGLLGQMVDAEVELRFEGDIPRDGRLLDFYRVSDEDPIDAWARWITERHKGVVRDE